MTKIITFIAILACFYLTAQTTYETSMTAAMELWKSEKKTEAVAAFERIASVETKEWLPNYYVALINATSAFEIKDKEKIKAHLESAQKAIDKAFESNRENPELLVIQGLIYTGWIVADPMTNGMRYSGLTSAIYAKAESIAPTNPRVVLSKAEFDMGTAQYFGQDTKPFCEKFKKAKDLFTNFKPETTFHPNWGIEKVNYLIENCK